MSSENPGLHPEVEENPEGVEPASDETQHNILDAIHKLAREDGADSSERHRARLCLDRFPDGLMEITIFEPGAVAHDDQNTRIATISEIELEENSQRVYLAHDYHIVDTHGGWLMVQDWRTGKDESAIPEGLSSYDATLLWPKREPEDTHGLGGGVTAAELTKLADDAIEGYVQDIPEQEFDYGLRMVSEEDAANLLDILERIIHQ